MKKNAKMNNQKGWKRWPRYLCLGVNSAGFIHLLFTRGESISLPGWTVIGAKWSSQRLKAHPPLVLRRRRFASTENTKSRWYGVFETTVSHLHGLSLCHFSIALTGSMDNKYSFRNVVFYKNPSNLLLGNGEMFGNMWHHCVQEKSLMQLKEIHVFPSPDVRLKVQTFRLNK